MLIMGIFSFILDIKHSLTVGFHSIMLWLDAIVYQFVAEIYNIFIMIAESNIFSQETYQSFSQRIYAILGVFMLFLLAYALLQALVDPDQLTKGDKGIGKMVPTFVFSLVMIGILPIVFEFAYDVQNFILEENTIGVLVMGSDVANSDTPVYKNKFGVRLAYTALHTFLNQENACENAFNGITCEEMENQISQGSSNFMIILNMADAIADGEVVYRWLFSTGVGLFLIYVIGTFTLDLAVRAVRLAFLQLIAPIPILMRVMPTKNNMFNNWLKKTLSSFAEVFVRVFIMYMAVFFISKVELNWESGSGFTSAIANLLIIMGIFMFVKEFPKLISDVTGIDSGNIKLGIKDFMGKLGAGGFFAAGGLLGAGASALVGNTANSFRTFGYNWKNSHGFFGKAGVIGRSVTSPFAGGVSGAFRGAKAGLEAKNFADMSKAMTTGSQGAAKAREDRAFYRASHGGTTLGVLGGHFTDAFDDAKSFMGLGPNVEALKRSQSLIQDVFSKRKAAMDAAEAEIVKQAAERTVSGAPIKFVDGQEFSKLAEIENELEIMKSTGKTSNNMKASSQLITELQAKQKEMKDRLVADYLNGVTTDGKGTDFSKIKGVVKENMVAFNTALKNNVGVIKSNLTDQNIRDLGSKYTDMQTIMEAVKNMSPDELIASQKMSDLMDNAKAVIGTSSTNVGMKINVFKQKAEQKENKK